MSIDETTLTKKVLDKISKSKIYRNHYESPTKYQVGITHYIFDNFKLQKGNYVHVFFNNQQIGIISEQDSICEIFSAIRQLEKTMNQESYNVFLNS